MNKFELISETQTIVEGIRKQKTIYINVYSPDGNEGIISLFKHKGYSGAQKIVLDLGIPDRFPWRLSEKGKNIMNKIGYSCGTDLISGFCIKGDEESFLNVLFETLSMNENMFERVSYGSVKNK